jgi:DNA-binding transcriptional ArsR family regulator
MKTKRSSPDLILHPVRVRIVYAIEGRELSPSQIADEVPDVPQASLYRHIRKLLDAGVLVVAQERQVHGTVERTYRVDPATVMVDPKKLVSHKGRAARYFEVFLSCLRQAFGGYVSQTHFDLKKDGVTFYSEFAYLSDEEQIALNARIREMIVSAQKNEAAPERRRRALSFIALPEMSRQTSTKGKNL